MFKSQLKSYEETEKFNCKPKTDQVMKTESPSFSASSYVTCYACGRKGQSYHEGLSRPDKTKSETTKCMHGAHTTSQQRIVIAPVEDITVFSIRGGYRRFTAAYFASDSRLFFRLL